MNITSKIKEIVDASAGVSFATELDSDLLAWGNGPSGYFHEQYIDKTDILQRGGDNLIESFALLEAVRATALTDNLMAEMLPYIDGTATRVHDGDLIGGVNIGSPTVQGWLTWLGADVGHALTAAQATKLISLADRPISYWALNGINPELSHIAAARNLP